MNRINFVCGNDFFKLLEELKNKTRISKSEIIRLAVTEWAKRRDKND